MRGDVLRKVVEESGLKPQVVIDRTGYRREHFYKILKKKDITVEELCRISRACGLKPGDLLENSADLLNSDTRPFLVAALALPAEARPGALRILGEVAVLAEQDVRIGDSPKLQPKVANPDLRNYIAKPIGDRAAPPPVGPRGDVGKQGTAATTTSGAKRDDASGTARGRRE